MWIAISVFIGVFFLLVSGGLLFVDRAEARRRLQRIGATHVEAAVLSGMSAEPTRSKLERMVYPLHSVLPRGEQEASAASRRLTQAGYRGTRAVNLLYAAKVFVPLSLMALAAVTGVFRLSPLFVFTTAAGLGYIGPDLWLSRRIAARKLEIRYGLPEALDLLVICLEAGLSLDRATLRTADELRISQPAIADELVLVNLEQRAGAARGEAWKHCGERTGVDTVQGLASVMIQADKFGTSVGKALRQHSETLRTRRRQDAEEQAAKTTVKLVFPLVLFIFPSLFLVTLGPSLITMFDAFTKYLS